MPRRAAGSPPVNNAAARREDCTVEIDAAAKPLPAASPTITVNF
jgi:hypothetical protein